MFFRMSHSAICMLFVVGLGGCGEATQPDPFAELRGTYVLKMVEGWPLPYFDYRTQFQRTGGTLELKRGGRYEKNDDAGRLMSYVSTGDYRLQDGRLTLVSDSGHEASYTYSDGTIISERAVYLREGRDIPPEYRWRLYDLHRCGGKVPSLVVPCAGTSVRGSTLWLRDNGEYHIADEGVAATLRMTGAYEITGDEIVMPGAWDNRHIGTLRNDTIELSTWVYVRAE